MLTSCPKGVCTSLPVALILISADTLVIVLRAMAL